MAYFPTISSSKLYCFPDQRKLQGCLSRFEFNSDVINIAAKYFSCSQHVYEGINFSAHQILKTSGTSSNDFKDLQVKLVQGLINCARKSHGGRS